MLINKYSYITVCLLSNVACFCRLLIFFQNQVFQKIILETPSEFQAAWILTWFQTVSKSYQQTKVKHFTEMAIVAFLLATLVANVCGEYEGLILSVHNNYRRDIGASDMNKLVSYLSIRVITFIKIYQSRGVFQDTYESLLKVSNIQLPMVLYVTLYNYWLQWGRHED